MIPCPKCQHLVEISEQQLGTLYTCPHCNAVYFIDWSGQPEVGEDNEDRLGHFVESEVKDSANVAGAENFPLSEGDDFVDGGSSQGVTDSALIVTHDSVLEENLNEAPYDFSRNLDSVPGAGEQSLNSSSDFGDVQEFANSNHSEGLMTYTLKIEDMDSSAIVREIFDQLADSRFGLDLEILKASCKNGTLIIAGLNPAKASVIVNRIKYLPVKIAWRQDVL